MTDSWCILRTSGRSTIPLVDELRRNGFEAWTPVDHEPRRIPRRRQREERQAPMMPTFVFARSSRLADLFALSQNPGRSIGFSIFHDRNRVPVVADRDLEALRDEEARSLARCRRIMNAGKRSERVYEPGEFVKIPDSSFGGMTGVVEMSDGRYTLVCFGGAMSVKISTWLLSPDESYSAAAARAA